MSIRYLGNDRNIVRNATLAASNIVASSAIYRTDTTAKAGGGKVSLTGPYTGQSDTTVDVEILDDTGGSSRVSQPVFAGIGNGVMSGLSASNVTAQDFTINVESMGTQTRKAYAPFQGVNLIARASGSPGNSITVEVDHSALSLASTDYALQDDLRAGTNEYIGEHWNFGAGTLLPDGSIPVNAPRLTFGEDPQVYRAYRRYREGRYVYGFSPSPVRDAERGTRVFAVAGSRSITITDGSTTDTLLNILSLYDALVKIRDESTLITVDAPVINSMLPGGQGATELSVYTTSHIIGVSASGGDSIATADLFVTATENAPTETLLVRCIRAAATGSEEWRVDGDVSLRLANATTNVAYADGPYAFTIPLPDVPQGDPGNTTGTMSIDYEPLPRNEGAVYPNVSFTRPVLGAAARNGTYTFVWTPRPPEDCTDEGVVVGGPRRECLGINPPGDETVSDASRIIRLQRLTAAVRTHVGSNTGPAGVAAAVDIAAIERGASILADGLRRLMAGTLENDPWEASTAYLADTIVEPIARDGYRYAVSTPGTSGASAPTWNTTVGATTSDGSVTWTNIGKVPLGMWDEAFTAWNNEAAMISAVGRATAVEWTSNEFANVGDYLYPSARNGCIYQAVGSIGLDGATNQATHGLTEPLWPTELSGSPGDRVTLAIADGGSPKSTWRLAYRYWGAMQQTPLGTVARPGNGHTYRVTTAGVTDATEPTWTATAGATVSDGTVTWTEIAAHDLPFAPTDAHFERYATAMHDVLAAAGIDPNFDFAGPDGDGCWQDPGDSGYWQSRNRLLPAFNNLYYHSSQQIYDEDGNPVNQSTREFGFGIAVGCPENLMFGDEVSIVIDGVAGSSTGRGYQEGDSFEVRVNFASPVPFGGGQTGDDTIVFSVSGSVDGRLPDYAVLTTAPAAYNGTVAAWQALTPYTAGQQRRPTVRNGKRYTASTGTSDASEPTWPTTIGATVVDGTVTWTCASADADVSFLITPGGLAYALGDRYTFAVEGGHYRWRRDGGSWSSSLAIEPTALTDGLAIAFAGGISPSWVDGDIWTFKAEATSGADQLRKPTDARCTWASSTSIVVTPATSGAIAGIFIGDHTIPSDAIIRLQGSDDNFSTTPVNDLITWNKGNIWHARSESRAKWRVTIDKGGSIQWLWLGDPFEPLINGDAIADQGILAARVRLPGIGVRRALGGEVEHNGLSHDAVEDMLDMLDQACENDSRRFGIVADDSDSAIVAYADDSIEIRDTVPGFHPTNPAKQILSVSLTLSPTP